MKEIQKERELAAKEGKKARKRDLGEAKALGRLWVEPPSLNGRKCSVVEGGRERQKRRKRERKRKGRGRKRRTRDGEVNER